MIARAGQVLAWCSAVHLSAVAASGQLAVPAERPIRWLTTLRADALVDRDAGAQVAVGLAVPAAYNVRLSIDAGAGGVQRPKGLSATGRFDLLARWLTDPFRQSRWAMHAGGGAGLRVERGRALKYVAIVTVGIEGPGTGTWLPGIELGLGGGVRAGVTLRRAQRRRR